MLLFIEFWCIGRAIVVQICTISGHVFLSLQWLLGLDTYRANFRTCAVPLLVFSLSHTDGFAQVAARTFQPPRSLTKNITWKVTRPSLVIIIQTEVTKNSVLQSRAPSNVGHS